MHFFVKICLTGEYSPCYNEHVNRKGLNMSPSQRKEDKKPLKVYVSQETHLKFSRLAEKRGCTMSNLLLQFILDQTKDIKLTAEDYEQIAADIRKGNKY